MVQTTNETKTKNNNNSHLSKIQFEDQRTSLTIQSSKSNLKMLDSSPAPVIPVAENLDVSSKNNNNQTSIESFYGLQIPSDKLNLVIAACAAGVIIGTIITSLLCLCCCRIIKRRRAGGLRQRSIKTTEISLTKKPKMLAPPTNMLTPDKRNKKDDGDDNSSKLRLKIGNRTRKESKKQKDTLDRNNNNDDDFKSNVTEALLKNSGSGLTFHHNHIINNNHHNNNNQKTHNSTSDNRGETFEHLNFGNHSTIQTNAGHDNVFLEGGIGERSRLLQNNSSIISSSQNQMISHPNHNGAFMSVSSTGHQISAHPIAANRYSLSGTPNQLVNPSTSSQHSSLGRNMTFSAGAVNNHNNNNPSPNWTNYSHFNPSHNISQFPTLHENSLLNEIARDLPRNSSTLRSEISNLKSVYNNQHRSVLNESVAVTTSGITNNNEDNNNNNNNNNKLNCSTAVINKHSQALRLGSVPNMTSSPNNHNVAQAIINHKYANIQHMSNSQLQNIMNHMNIMKAQTTKIDSITSQSPSVIIKHNHTNSTANSNSDKNTNHGNASQNTPTNTTSRTSGIPTSAHSPSPTNTNNISNGNNNKGQSNFAGNNQRLENEISL